MRRLLLSSLPLLVLLASSAAPAAPDGKALTAGETLSAAFEKGSDYEQRRHAFSGKRGQTVSFSAEWVELQRDLEGSLRNSPTIGMFWVEDASGTKPEVRRLNGEGLKQSLSVVLPSDGPWFLVTKVRAPAAYELKMFPPQAPPVLRLNETLGAGILVGESAKHFEVTVTPDQEGKRLALLLNGEFPEKMAVALLPAPEADVLPCEAGPCTTRDFIWKAKAGTYYLRVTPEVTTGCVLGLHSIPADAEPIKVGRAIESSLGGPVSRKSYLLSSMGGEFTFTLSGLEGRLELGELGKAQSELNAEFLDGHTRVPLSKGTWILTVSAKAPLPRKTSFRFELAPPRPPPSTTELLGAMPKEPVGGNVAYLDLNDTLAQLPEGKAGRERLKVLFETSKKQLDEKRAEVQSKKGEEQKVVFAAYEALGRNLEAKLSSENDKATLPLLEKLGGVVRKLREERGVTVFEASVVGWADASANLAPAVIKAMTGAASPKEKVKEHKLGLVDFRPVMSNSGKAKAAKERLAAIEHHLARAEAAQKEEALIYATAGKALEKLAGARGITLVLIKEGIDAEYPGLVFKTPPVDLTAELLKAVDAQ